MTRPVRCTMLLVVALAAAACGGGSRAESPRAPSSVGSAGRQAWRWTAPPPAYVGMPSADETGIAVAYGQTWLVFLDTSGRPQWTARHDGLRDTPPLLTPESVIAATEDGLVAFDRAAGGARWAAGLGDRANAPVPAGGLVVATTWAGSLAAVDLATGAPVWTVTLPGGAIGPAAAGDGVVVATWEADDGSAAGAVAVEAASGRRRWDAALEPGGVGAPAVALSSGVVVVVAGDVAVHGLGLATGAVRWRTEVEGAGSPEVPPLPLAGGEVLVAHRLGGLVMLAAAEGRVRWKASSDGAAVRGGPAGPGPDGRFALPLHDGRVLLAGPDRPTEQLQPAGLVAGVAIGPGGTLLVATREAEVNGVSAMAGW